VLALLLVLFGIGPLRRDPRFISKTESKNI